MINVKLKPVVLAVAGVLAAASTVYAADNIKAGKVDVISVTPLQGIGITLNKVPSNIQVIKTEDLKTQQSLSIADYMNDNLQGVSVSDTQNNPYQPDITFRGYSISPILGGQTGMSVYVDGVRVNEPFGDGVNWDLIPVNAISGITLMPGSNPLFGLNTLGGALSVQTKSGRNNQGAAAELSAGSWGRKTGAAEIGGVSKDGSVDYFFSANMFSEDGWRDHSNTDVRQFFGKVGWQNETTKIDLSYTAAHNDMVGNGLIQKEFMETLGRGAIHTKPDQTLNTMSFLNLSGSHWFNDDVMFSANTYYRNSKRRTLNGDVNDGFELGSSVAQNNIDCRANTGGDADEWCPGALNRSITRQESYGANGQFTFNQDIAAKKNQLSVGAFYDFSRMYNEQSREYGLLNADRGVDGLGFMKSSLNTKLRGDTNTWSLFGTDTLSLNDMWHLTLSARYNHTEVDNVDGNFAGTARSYIYKETVPGTAPTGPYVDSSNTGGMTRTAVYSTLTAKSTFSRLNPSLGLTFTPTKDLTVYGSYNEGNRAPTSMELGCADPLVPCKLPNAMAGDPPLEQVVAKTFEGGLRGNLTDDVKWSIGAYRSELNNDIQFISSSSASNGMGYFDNVGKTRRVGFDTSLVGKAGNFSWTAGYSFVDATYQTDLDLANQVNSSRYEVDAALPDGTPLYDPTTGLQIENEVIRVKKGNRLAGIPQHQLKFRLQYAITPDWTVGSNITAFSDRYMRGNENNAHVNQGDSMGNGKVAGYAIVNLDTKYNLGNGWSVFGKAVNVFDTDYNNGGMMAQSMFTSGGTFTGVETNSGFLSPGAPRAGWVGVRYEFLAPKAQ